MRREAATRGVTARPIERRRTTIVAADLAGYSRLVAQDETGVIERLRALRADLIDPLVAKAGARVVKTMGDGLLVEFPSPLAAVQTAAAVQKAMVDRAAQVMADQRLLFRIGINFGDVILDGDDVLGDVVNIAARLESLAPPGGICISRPVLEATAGALARAPTALGPQYVKNIHEPVEVWRIEVDGVAAPAPVAIARHERPSVAVLAFEALATDDSARALADGLAEDVITQLSRFRSLFVIARASSFAYRGSTKDARQIGRELGVKYLVTGSMRQSGPRLRLATQLVEADTGHQVWSGRWDRDVQDLFTLQDDLTRAVISGIAPELGANERGMASAKPTESLTAWELCQRGLSEFHQFSASSYQATLDLLQAAIAADPAFALPRALLARWHAVRIFSGRSPDPREDIAQGMAQAMAAIQLDDRLEDAYIGMALILTAMGREADARHALERAQTLNDNHPGVFQAQTFINLFQPRPDPDEMEAAGLTALRLSPNDPSAWAFHWAITCARWIRDGILGQNVRDHLTEACRLPQAENFVLLAGAVMNLELGDEPEARRLLDAALAKNPGLTLQSHVSGFRFPYWPTLKLTILPHYERLVGLGLARA